MRRFRIDSDIKGAVGLGAMIIFIGMILLSAIVSFTIIHITEELAQDSQNRCNVCIDVYRT